MISRMFVVFSLIFMLATFAIAQSTNKNYIEVRTARAQDGGLYGYFNYNRQINKDVVFDFIYTRSSGVNETFTGVGFTTSVTKKLTVTPLVYVVVGENGQYGMAVGTTVSGSVRSLNISGSAGHFEPISGPVPRYNFVDTLDLTSTVSKRSEVGISTKLFNQLGQNFGGIGPMYKRSDKRGFFSVSARFGTGTEIQFTRAFVF